MGLPSVLKGRVLNSGYGSQPLRRVCGSCTIPTGKVYMVFIIQEPEGKRCVHLPNFQSPTLTPDSRKKGHFGPRLSGIMEEPFGVDLALFYGVSLTLD